MGLSASKSSRDSTLSEHPPSCDKYSSVKAIPLSTQELDKCYQNSEMEQDAIDYNDFDLEGFTIDEVRYYNSIAEPGQRLQDTVDLSMPQHSFQELSSRLTHPWFAESALTQMKTAAL